MHRIAAVVLVVAVVLAGCNGVFGGKSDDTATLTPAAVPTDEPTPTPVSPLAPGLTGNGVGNATALAAAHDAALDDASFTERRTLTYRTTNGTPVRRVTSVTRVGSDGRFRVTRRWNGTPSLRRVAYYNDGDRLLVATTTTGGTSYRRAASRTATTGESVIAGTGAERIERAFAAAETRVAGRTGRDGTAVYRLVPADDPDGVNATGPDQSVSVRARVTESGLVRSHTLRQTLSGAGFDEVTAIVVTTRYTDIGSTAVERPPWYGAALAETTTTRATPPAQPERTTFENSSARTVER